MDIVVNGRRISEDAVYREMQYHPAASVEEARESAARALAIRELLLDRAARLGLAPVPEPGEDEAEALIRQLIEREVRVPEPDRDSCLRYYENNRAQLRTPDVYTVSHILIPAPPDAPHARDMAEARARQLLAELQAEPRRFPELAQRFSACPSRTQGGRMGRVRRGETVPEFERALAGMQPGELSHRPVETRYGYHIILLEACESGRPLTFDEAYPLIADYLRESVFRRALAQYVQLLAGQADIVGIDLRATETPLVQ
ncbi:peptidylprolyl isomerase [Pelomicrobium sp.]|jgi:peptidyl-prolyl cis-trans isomerase C|uniref:peptidylprolyl isomerase n=1 Tax=Pelomicrobium sp. TaxID=2815319 RepID=UPI002FDCE3A2